VFMPFWRPVFNTRQRLRFFPPAFEAHPTSYLVVSEGKERPGREADHSPPFSAGVKNE
jgi:hypothetical protein